MIFLRINFLIEMSTIGSNQEYNENEVKAFLKKVGQKDLNTVQRNN